MNLSTDNKPFKLAIFGASGFAREIADIALEIGCKELVFILKEPEDITYFEYALLSEGEIIDLQEKDFQFAIGVGDNKLRKKIYAKFDNLSYPNIIHPTVTMGQKQIDNLDLKNGNILAAGVRFTNNIKPGNFGIYNLNCTVGHDCIIKNFVNLAPGVNLSGNVFIGDGVYIGTNASILQGDTLSKKLSVGEYTTIGAGAVVTKDIPANSVAIGIPAEIKKPNSLVRCS